MRRQRILTTALAMLLLLQTALVTTPAVSAQNAVDEVLATLGDDLQTRSEWSKFYFHSNEIVSPGRTGGGPIDDIVSTPVPDGVPGGVSEELPEYRFQMDFRRPDAVNNYFQNPVTGNGPDSPGEADRVIIIGPEQVLTSNTQDNQVVAGSVATFQLPPPLNVHCPAASGFDELAHTCHTITDLDALLYASALPGAALTSSDIHVAFHIIDADGNRVDHGGNCSAQISPVFPCNVYSPVATMALKRQDPSVGTTAAAPVSIYQGSLKLGIPNVSPDPIQLKVGERIGVDIKMTDGVAILHTDRAPYPSSVSTFGDSTRMAAWVEDTQGRARDVFPSAAYLTASQRHIIAQGVQFNVWGGVDCGGVNDRNSVCPLDNIDQSQMRLRIRELVPSQRGFYPGDAITLDPLGSGGVSASTVASCCDAGEIDYEGRYDTVALYSYNFPYPADFEDGAYRLEFFQPQSHVNPWVVSHDFNVATLNFDMASAPGGSLVHKVLPGEATEFTVRLYNNGSITDHVSLALRPPTAGWTATLSETGLQMVPGDYQDVRVTVTPPSGAKVGDESTVTLTAVSTGNDIKTLRLRNVVVSADQAVPGIDLSTAQSVVDVRPGQINAVPVTLKNTGLRADTFLVTVAAHGDTDDNNNCGTWGLGMESPTARIASQSRQDVIIQVTPPSNTPPSELCVLAVRAQGLGASSAVDSLLIPLQITVRTGVELTTFGDTNRQMRAPGASICHSQDFLCLDPAPDRVFDPTAVFRVPITNVGDLSDNFTLQGSWIRGFGEDKNGCDGPNNNGVPDGWRFQYPPSGLLPSSPQPGLHSLDVVTLGPGETAYRFIELGYDHGDVCSADGFQPASPNAKFRVTARSANDGTVIDTIDLTPFNEGRGNSKVADSEFYQGAAHGVAIEMDNRAKNVRTTTAVDDDEDLGDITFRLRAINTGNEHSDVTISIEENEDGWTHSLQLAERVPSGVNCEASDESDRVWNCDLGIFDEVAFIARLTPAHDAAIGDQHEATVSAQVDSFRSIVRTQKIIGRVVGEYAFAADLATTDIKVTAGETARVPLTIFNEGTEDDRYFITIPTAPLDWNPEPSLQSIDIPAGGIYHGFIQVAALGADGDGEFTVQIRNLADGGNKSTAKPMTFRAVREADTAGFDVRGASSGDQLVRLGDSSKIAMTITDTRTVRAGKVNITVAGGVPLPIGWDISPRVLTNVTMPESGLLTQEFTLTVPRGMLPASRLPIQVGVTAGNGIAEWTDMTVGLASSHGVRLTNADEAFSGVIGRGGTHTVEIKVTNIGLSEDTIIFCENTIEPKLCKHFFSGPRDLDGFHVTYNPERIVLGALETGVVRATVHAPTDRYPLSPGEKFTAVLFAQSISDSTRGASLDLPFESAVHQLQAEPIDGTVWVEPEAQVMQRLYLNNTGSLPLRDLTLEARVPAQGDASLHNVRFTFEDQDIDLEPGESIETRMYFDMPVDLHDIPVFDRTVQAIVSIGSFNEDLNRSINAGDLVLPEIHTRTTVLPHVAFDADDDFIREYAVDRNRDAADGFEAFLETNPDAGVFAECISCYEAGTEPVLAQFLTDEARSAKTIRISQGGQTTNVLDYTVDPDDDGRNELLLDVDGDRLPDVYWDPASRAGEVTQVWQQLANARVSGGGLLNLPKDVTADGVLDYFIDLDMDTVLTPDGVFNFHDGGLDVVFDITTGEFTPLLKTDLDNNGVIDYIVDSNKNGAADSGEAVLFAADGRLRTVQIIDVDGDGIPDEVFTVTDRGPNYFIRNGGTGASIPINLKDVTEDGVADWTFDMDGDGTDESYYDPVHGEAGVIPQDQGILEVAKDFWYIGILLAAVTVLFVVLLAVTRR